MRTSIREIQMASRGARRGTIRAGEFDAGKPKRRETWLLTSPDKTVLESMAPVFGGAPVEPFASDRSNDQWALDTGTNELRVLLSTYGEPISQRYELYGAGGLVRNCDGQTCQTVDQATGEMVERDCMCSQDRPECKLATRLSVVLVDAVTFGSWLFTTGSENAAYELPFAVNMLMAAEGQGRTVPAILRLEQRSVKKQGEKYPRRFAVPVLDADSRAFRPEQKVLYGENGPIRISKMPGDVVSQGSGDGGGHLDSARTIPAQSAGDSAPAEQAGSVALPADRVEPSAPVVGSGAEGSPASDDDALLLATPASEIPSLITEPQRKRMMAIARKKGVATDDLKAIVLDLAGVTSSKAIPADKYDGVINGINAWAELHSMAEEVE